MCIDIYSVRIFADLVYTKPNIQDLKKVWKCVETHVACTENEDPEYEFWLIPLIFPSYK